MISFMMPGIIVDHKPNIYIGVELFEFKSFQFAMIMKFGVNFDQFIN